MRPELTFALCLFVAVAGLAILYGVRLVQQDEKKDCGHVHDEWLS